MRLVRLFVVDFLGSTAGFCWGHPPWPRVHGPVYSRGLGLLAAVGIPSSSSNASRSSQHLHFVLDLTVNAVPRKCYSIVPDVVREIFLFALLDA